MKARPIALAKRIRLLPAFVASTKCFHQLPQARAVSFVDQQRLRRAPPTRQGCHTRGAADFASAAPIAANAWRSSSGRHPVEHRRQRRMFYGDARAPSSIGGRQSYDSSFDDSSGGGDGSSAAVLELEPMVERVASALKQRCSVRGGDLVRMLGTVSCGLDTAQQLGCARLWIVAHFLSDRNGFNPQLWSLVPRSRAGLVDRTTRGWCNLIQKQEICVCIVQ